MRLLAMALIALSSSAVAEARTIHGLVYVDSNGDHVPSAGEPTFASAVVAYEVSRFVVTNGAGAFELDIPDDGHGNVWVRVPDGFVPGPVWAPVGKSDSIDLAIRPLPAPHRGPLTFVVAADSHLAASQPFFADLAQVVTDATAIDPPAAFFTILGDITQGNQDAEFDLVDRSLRGLDIPYIPVPGNHDWYDGGATWKRRYGPDNYSFDLGGVHFIVWNMAMSELDVARYLGAELARVAPEMTIVAMTHAPPSPRVLSVLERLGVDYLLTGHTHSNRVLDHGHLIEVTTEPLLMGGLDYTPAGYRVMTLDGGTLRSDHRTVVDAPVLEVIAPARGQCVPALGGELVVAAELDAAAATVTAQVDCGLDLPLSRSGGWSWRTALPALYPGRHTITVDARSASGDHARRYAGIEVCVSPPFPPAGADWPQVGGAADHAGAVHRELAPPLVAEWTASIGGHALTAAPVIAGGAVFLTVADLGNGTTGGVVAFDLATGTQRWRTMTPIPTRGAPAVVGDLVIATQIDGTVLGFDARDGTIRWRSELGIDVEPKGAATFAAPVADASDVLVGNQRRLASLDARTGTALWLQDPVRRSEDFNSLAALAVSDGVAVGVFDREIGGIFGWERATGTLLWHVDGGLSLSINAAPVIANGLVYLVNGATEVFALELHTGVLRWKTKLDPTGFDWAVASVGTPAIARGILVVPMVWGELVAVDATSGMVLWRFAARPGPLRTTHYRGRGEAGFEASPVITGGLVWAADTSGRLTALGLESGAVVWQTDLRAPVLAGLATSGNWLVVATYDGTVRALRTTATERRVVDAVRCDLPARGGCCQVGAQVPDLTPVALAVVAVGVRVRRRRKRARVSSDQ